MMAMRSVSVRLSRETSVTISVSPRFMRRISPPNLPLLLAAGDLRHPLADGKISTVGETPDLVLLVSRVLFARADP